MATTRKRGNSYQIRVSVGYDTKGNQVVKTKTWKPSAGMTAKQIEKELLKQAIMFEEQCLNGVVTTDIKFEEFAERWFEEYAKSNLKKTTLSRMTSCKIRIYPALGHFHLSKITRGQVQAFIDDLARNGKNLRTGEPLSRKTIVHHLNFLSDVFMYAARQELISETPCKNIILPRGEKKEKAIYTVDEVKTLFKLMDEHDAPIRFKAFVNLAVYGGFRRGEIMGLEWKDIDWDNNVVSIRRTSNYTQHNGVFTDTTKTKKSQRSLKLPDTVFTVLRQLYEEQQNAKAEIGNQWVDYDRLFVTWNGSPLFCGMPYRWLKSFTEKHGMRFCDLHSFRHFNATVLINSGVDAATVSSALGHSNVTTTTSIYCHAFQEVQARTGNAIAAALDLSECDKAQTKKAVRKVS